MVVKYLQYMVKNYLFFIITSIFVIMYWVSASGLPERSVDFPRALMFAIVPLFVWNAVNSILGFRGVMRKQAGTEGAQQKRDWTLGITLPRVIITAATIAYIILLPILGFVITSVLYLALLTFYLGIRNPLKLAAFTLVYTAALYGVFVVWLHVRLPSGIFM